MKTRAPQFDFNLPDEIFHLAVQTTLDGVRLQQEMDAAAADTFLARQLETKQQSQFQLMNILTTTLRNGRTVLAKLYQGELCAVTYSNRTQAQRKAAELGHPWQVAQFGGRPFYVAHFPDQP